jgi:hypothetical protein
LDHAKRRQVIIVSVPHTGTVFVKTLLSKAKLNPIQHHCHSDSVFLLKSRPNAQIVVPLRHPEKAWRTWCLRGTGLQERRQRAKYEQFRQAWVWLDEICRDYDVLYLPIDLPERDQYLETMSEALDIPLETDWAPRGATAGSLIMHEPQERDLSDVMALDVVRRFYE